MNSMRRVTILKKERSPYWKVRWFEEQPDGTWKERMKSTRSKRKSDAEKLRRKIERELDAGNLIDADLKWDDFVAEFLAKHAKRKAPMTYDAYELALRVFTRSAKPRWLKSVTLAVLEDYVNERLAAGFSPHSVNKDLRHLRAALRWGYKRSYIRHLPDFGTAFVKVDRTHPDIIPEEDFIAMVRATASAKLRHCSAGWWRVFLYLSYYLGTRRSETVGLTWDRINFDTLEVFVEHSTSKGKKDRVVPIAPELGSLLQEWRSSNETLSLCGHVLFWPHENYRKLYDDWHAIQDAAGINREKHYKPKDCRSSCASGLIAANVPTAVVRDFLGHESVGTTERYYINTKPALRAAAKARKVTLA